MIAKSYVHRSGELHHHPFNATINIADCTGVEDCGNGKDDDGDGQVDCNDSDCGKPTNLSVDKDNPCPGQDNGSFTINASGNHLQYSINNGNSYQTSNYFNGLTAGNYTIRVKNNETGCSISTTTNLANGNCSEICNNGIDDDNDGKTDCADTDCSPSISSVNSVAPTNCPMLNNGSITISATSGNLEYSINNGSSYQSAPFFGNLSNGSYTIKIRNVASGCIITVSYTHLTLPTIYSV